MKRITMKCKSPQTIGILFMVLCFIINTYSAFGQENSEEHEFKRNKLTLAISHTHVPAGINENGDKVWLALPSWGLDYDFRLSPKWGLGIHSDIVIQDFEFEEAEGIIKKRTNPLATTFVATYEAVDHLKLMAGGGAEFASEGTLGLIRFGADYGWELPKEWELSLSLMADFKIDAYNAWVLGVGIGKTF